MQYGVREICNVVLKDIVTKEPVAYFETLKTSTLEFSGSTVYATGGRGNPKRIGWDSDREISMKMEDGLISKETFAIATGTTFKATTRPIHKKEVLTVEEDGTDKIIKLTKKPTTTKGYNTFFFKTDDGSSMLEKLSGSVTTTGSTTKVKLTGSIESGDMVIADYYIDAPTKSQSMDITSKTFPGTYLLEADTLWRNEDDEDFEAKYTIPKLKIKPNFTLTHGAAGDPSVFNFEAEVLADKKSGDGMVFIDLLEE
ncbi:hypothetical protein [Brevibacillus laterosporus]|uniref:Uncharacterized protein n=1 Tax=Brevibacillus laterosporus TaxID=1465 RepID=A0A385T1C3_BRELA|nr:hypothetical protein [Brevibacillus laterosporus]AYB37526.1 hypothetical protein D5F52_04110 [Brevibacillus laterosporus]MBM7110954.1 hypothetical protein [Brevibacillus laterosporus]QDX94752.1 hypothetical protein EEL30_22175 [Brevibacillus laterosporus]